jgi:hypothetical protein
LGGPLNLGDGLGEGLGVEINDPARLDGHEEPTSVLRRASLAGKVDDTL